MLVYSYKSKHWVTTVFIIISPGNWYPPRWVTKGAYSKTKGQKEPLSKECYTCYTYKTTILNILGNIYIIKCNNY